MQTDVRQEPGLLGERLVTVGALEGLLPCVEPAVRLQVRGTAESFTTLGAFKRPVPTVDCLVCHQVRRLMKVLTAGAAFELPLLVVSGEVKGQVGGGDEGFVAHAAAVRVQADTPVWPSTIREAAALLTGGTFGRLLFRR